jgi:hypothetical protein
MSACHPPGRPGAGYRRGRRGRSVTVQRRCCAAVARDKPRLAGTANAYGSSLNPFHRHLVRAFFGDPRSEGCSISFHFEIDILAPSGDLARVLVECCSRDAAASA